MTNMRPSIPEPDLGDLYRELIVEHYRKPHHHGSLPSPTVHTEGMNPLCGDEIMLDVRFEDGAIADSAFSGHGCAISQASASLMTDQITGQKVDETAQLIGAFERMLTKGEEPGPELGDLEALQG